MVHFLIFYSKINAQKAFIYDPNHTHMFTNEFLIDHGILWKDFSKNELIFKQHQKPSFFYQIIHGKVKLFSFNEDGKEFIQRIFHAGQSFGEPPLIGDFDYPINAAATEPTRIFHIPKEHFFQLLKDFPEKHLQLTYNLSKRLLYKSLLLKEISFESPKHRILNLLFFLKKEQQNRESFKVNLTRNEIAKMTGLRIETVIRAVKQLEKEGKLELRDKKNSYLKLSCINLEEIMLKFKND